MQVFIRFLLAVAAAWSCLQSETAFAAFTNTYGNYDVTFYQTTDTSHDGYSISSNWTTTQQQDVQNMLSMWQNLLANVPARPISVSAVWYDFGGASIILGGSSSNFYGNSVNAYSGTELVWREGVNAAPSEDLLLVFNSNQTAFTWHFGSAAPPGPEWDFESVMAHEVGHSLGFISTYGLDLPGGDFWWNGGITNWDSYLWDAASGGNQPLAGSTGTLGNFNETANPVYFGGANAVAANGGSRVQVYAPAAYASGSSLTHLNQGTYPTALMQPALGSGVMRRAPIALEQAILTDLGWTVVPEPVALAFWGCGALLLLRRRRLR